MRTKAKFKPSIIVLAHSRTWSSLVRRTFGHAKLCWVLDLDTIEEQAAKHDARVAIVEVPTTSAADMCVQLSHLTNNSSNLKIFTIGSSALCHWRKPLQVAGVAMTCWSTLQASWLAQTVQRHLENSASSGHQSLESLVEADLPWPTAAKSSTA